ELEVTAQAEPLVFSQVGRVITTITKQEIEQAPVSNLADLLSFVQSVDIRQRGGYGIQADVSIRGGSFDQVLILLNGMPISDPQTGHFNLNIPVELSDIQKVEILKGPGARTFGSNAYSGAINIITKALDENSLNMRASGGQHALYHYGATVNTTLKNWKTRLSYDQKGSDGYMENTDFKSYNAFVQSVLDLKKISLDAQIGFMKKDFGANSFYSPKYPMQFEKNEGRLASLGIHFGKRVKISILPYYRQHRDNWQLTRENPEIYQNFHQTDVYGGRAKIIFFSLLGKTTIGLDYKNEHLLSTSMGEEMEVKKTIPWAKNHEFKYHYQRNHTGIYFEQSKSFLKKWNITAGLLSHWYSGISNAANIYPGLDISYHINKRLKIFASANNAMRLPTFTDLFYAGPSNIGNPDLKPETSLSFELGTSYSHENYKLEASIFRTYGTNSIDWVWQNDVEKWHTENITKITTNGFEVSSQINPSNLWQINFWKRFGIDYTYLDLIKEASDVKSKYALNNLRHQLHINFQFEIISHLFLQLQTSYQDRMGYYQTYDFTDKAYIDHPYEDYWILNGKISYKYEYLKLYIEAKNIGDTDIIEYGIPQAGLWVMGGINYSIRLK
ncbi:MAG: TonB-dependent receptor, partial [Bacteroidales bacterium]|nr:TonB-dependent receptor [Bacteroidales bacterium]